MKRITLTVALLMAILETSHAKLSKECLVDYLKYHNVEDEAFDSIEKFSGDPGTCSNDVKSKVLDIYAATRTKMEADFRQKPFADCVMKEITNEAYENILLQAEVVELKGVGLRFWKLSSKNRRIEQLQNDAQQKVNAAFVKCKGENNFGAFFDTFFEQQNMEMTTDQFDYCLRKHLTDKSLINLNLYGFKMNPKNIYVDSSACEALITAKLVELKANIASAGPECVIDTFIKNGYLDMILKIQLLTRLTLTPTEKSNEKHYFVNSMMNMTEQIKSCYVVG